MLVALSIRDIVLIDRLSHRFRLRPVRADRRDRRRQIDPARCLSLALGGRGDVGLVRHGAAQGDVTAVFDVSRQPSGAGAAPRKRHRRRRRHHPAPGAGRATGAAAPSSTISRCRASLLREAGASLVEIHGQHDDRALVEPRRPSHAARRLRRPRRDAAEVAAHHRAWRQRSVARRRASASGLPRLRREADYLRAAVAELADARAAAGRGDGARRAPRRR